MATFPKRRGAGNDGGLRPMQDMVKLCSPYCEENKSK
jgi:hypothetical protein